jgi:hypothetical protein
MSELELNREIDRWFRENYNSLLYQVKRNIAKDGMSMYAEELLSHVILWTLERKPEMKEQMLRDNKIENYILRACSMQLRSSTSPFYREARKFKMSARSGVAEVDDILDEGSTSIESNPQYECMMREIKNLHWYHQKLIEEKWINGLTYQDMRIKYGITLSSLKSDFIIIYDIIRKKCQTC